MGSSGTNFNQFQHEVWTRGTTLITAGNVVNYTVTFPASFGSGNIPRVIIGNSTTASGTPAVNYLLVSAQAVTESNFTICIANVHPSVNFNSSLSFDYIAFR